MKIVYIVHGTYNSAGMERILTLKANYLADKLGYDIIIVTTDQRGREPYYKLSEKITCTDISINFDLYYQYPILKRIFSFLVKQYSCKRKLTDLLKRLNADIVISLMNRTNSYLSSINDGSKKVFESHFNKNVREQMLAESSSSLLKRIVYRTRSYTDIKYIKRLDALIVLTHEDAKQWGHLNNLRVIPNMLSFLPVEKAELENKTVITVGRLEPQKGYDYLVDIWSPVFAKHPDWKLFVFGTGADLKKIQSQIKESNLEDNIVIKQPTKEIEKELLSGSIYLMSSRYEGFPMVLVEAMACGLPAVSFRCPCGPSDIIRDSVDGFLVDVGDVQTMSNKINYLIENSELRKKMGMQARVNIKRYSQDSVMNLWNNFFIEITSA